MRSPVVRFLVVVGLAAAGTACDSSNDNTVRKATTTPSASVASSTLPAFPGGPNPPSNVDGGNQQLGGSGYKGHRPTTTLAP